MGLWDYGDELASQVQSCFEGELTARGSYLLVNATAADMHAERDRE